MTDIVILTGVADTRWTWRPVEVALGELGSVLVADRTSHATFPSLADETANLTELVAGHRLERPFVVAHSFGALIAEAYARRHPVSGLLLVDPAWYPDAKPRGTVGAGMVKAMFGGAEWGGRLLDVTGLARHVGPALWRVSLRTMAMQHPNAGVAAAARSVYRRGETLVAAAAEELAFRDFAAALAGLRTSSPVGDVPVAVLTAVGVSADSRDSRAWIKRHRQLAALFPQGRHEIVRGAKHMVHVDRPEVIVRQVHRCLER